MNMYGGEHTMKSGVCPSQCYGKRHRIRINCELNGEQNIGIEYIANYIL